MNGSLHFPATGQWKFICLRAIFNDPGRAEPCSESAPLLRSPRPSHSPPSLQEPASDITASSRPPFHLLASCFGVLCSLLSIRLSFGAVRAGRLVGWQQQLLGRLSVAASRVHHPPHP